MARRKSLSKAQARAAAHLEMASQQTGGGDLLRQVILGGQDGLVNTLGVLLGIATATNDFRIVIIGGLAATFAESISMAAVAYASSRAEQDYYWKMLEREKKEIEELPEVEREEVRLIYMKKGFRGRQLDGIVKTVVKDKLRWLDLMMNEELGLSQSQKVNPVKESLVVGFAAIIGSLIPLAPFFFLPVTSAAYTATAIAAVTLFIAGIYKAKITIGNWLSSGLEMAGIGMLAAIAGYAIGAVLGATVH